MMSGDQLAYVLRKLALMRLIVERIEGCASPLTTSNVLRLKVVGICRRGRPVLTSHNTWALFIGTYSQMRLLTAVLYVSVSGSVC